MPCRLCGKELPLFKKLADTEFCSAEHRELFVEQQHRTMLQRLEESALRLKRRRASVRTAFEPPPPPDPNPAPAPLAGFLADSVRFADRYRSLWEAVLEFLACERPRFAVFSSSRCASGILYAPPLRLLVPAAAGTWTVAGAPSAAESEPLIALPAWDLRLSQARPALARLFRMRPKQPVEGATGARWMSAERVAGESRPILPVLTGGGQVLFVPLAPPRSAAPLEALSVNGDLSGAAFAEVPPVRFRPPSLHLRVLGILVPEELAPPLRVRPRTAELPGAAPESIAPADAGWGRVPALPMNGGRPEQRLLSLASAVAWPLPATCPSAGAEDVPAYPLAATSAVLPIAGAPRAAAARMAGTVTLESDPLRHGDARQVAAETCEFVAPSVLPALPAHAPSPRLPEIASALPVRSTLRHGAAVCQGRQEPDSYAALPAVPRVPGVSELVPRLSSRLFRAKPRAGVTGHAAPWLGALSATDPQIDVGALPRLRCGLAGVVEVPAPLTRPLRMRKQAPVFSTTVPQSLLLDPETVVPAPVASLPATPVPAVRAALEPQQRFFRFRPRRPAGPDRPEAVAMPVAAESGHLLPAAAGLSRAGRPFAPRLSERLYRMRPRQGVNAPAGLQISAPTPASGRFRTVCPASRLSPNELAASARLFRMRPRAGVPAQTARVFAVRQLPVPAPALLWPHSTPQPCAPGWVDRLFRMRPRNPVGARTPEPCPVPTGPAEPGEIFVMPPVPQLHVEYVYELPRADRTNRLNPPGPSAGAAGPRPLSQSGPEGVDTCKVARAMVQLPRLGLLPAGLPAIRRPSLVERLRGRLAMPRWTAVPALRFATCGVFIIGAFVGYASLSSSPDVQADAPRPTRAVLADVRTAVAGRSAVSLHDDFTSGLHSWEGAGNWARSWSYDQSGGVKPGELALWTPTLGLANYSFIFSGQIEKNALGFVVRAADRNNCYAVKLVISRPGPVPAVDIVRYPIIGGKAEKAVRKRLPLTVYNNTIYQVRLTAERDSLILSVNEQVVDSWTEPRLPSGGAGFFSANGERARILSVRVSHQDDTLGKALAYVVQDAPQTGKGISR